jgi:methylated-DNA-[protein]-cysteine S-methyltransferase
MTDTIMTTVSSPVGELTLTATEEGLTGVYFDRGSHPPPKREVSAWVEDDGARGRASEILADARAQLAAYFAGDRTSFDLPLAPGGTEFQRRVWSALREIAFGSTTSYGDIARQIGAPKAVRAVGAANGRNPIPIIVPCHRVIGSNGSLTGFGGGIERKEWLLSHEGALERALEAGS